MPVATAFYGCSHHVVPFWFRWFRGLLRWCRYIARYALDYIYHGTAPLHLRLCSALQTPPTLRYVAALVYHTFPVLIWLLPVCMVGCCVALPLQLVDYRLPRYGCWLPAPRITRIWPRCLTFGCYGYHVTLRYALTLRLLVGLPPTRLRCRLRLRWLIYGLILMCPALLFADLILIVDSQTFPR